MMLGDPHSMACPCMIPDKLLSRSLSVQMCCEEHRTSYSLDAWKIRASGAGNRVPQWLEMNENARGRKGSVKRRRIELSFAKQHWEARRRHNTPLWEGTYFSGCKRARGLGCSSVKSICALKCRHSYCTGGADQSSLSLGGKQEGPESLGNPGAGNGAAA